MNAPIATTNTIKFALKHFQVNKSNRKAVEALLNKHLFEGRIDTLDICQMYSLRKDLTKTQQVVLTIARNIRFNAYECFIA
jgi:hypothetical protein